MFDIFERCQLINVTCMFGTLDRLWHCELIDCD